MKKPGFSLVECLIAVIVLITISAAIFVQCRSERILFSQQIHATFEKSIEIHRQEVDVKEYAMNRKPEETFDDFYEKIVEIAYSDVKIKAMSTDDAATGVLGNYPTHFAIPRKIIKQPLKTPSVNSNSHNKDLENTKFIVSKFPVYNFLKYPSENPPSTKYLFTDKPDQPLEKWGKWCGGHFEVKELPRNLFIKAMHSECYYMPSENLEMEFVLPTSRIVFSREINGPLEDEYRFTIDEITSGANKIKLDIDVISEFYEIQYAIDDGDQTSEKVRYDNNKGFHAFSKQGRSDKATLTVWANARNSRFDDYSFSKTFPLTIKKLKFKNPIIHISPGSVLYKGDSIRIDKKESHEIGRLNVALHTNGGGNIDLQIKEENS